MPPCGIIGVGVVVITCGETIACVFHGALTNWLVGRVVVVPIVKDWDGDGAPMWANIALLVLPCAPPLVVVGLIMGRALTEVAGVIEVVILFGIVDIVSPKVRGGVDPTTCGACATILVPCSNCCTRLVKVATLDSNCPIIACICPQGGEIGA